MKKYVTILGTAVVLALTVLTNHAMASFECGLLWGWFPSCGIKFEPEALKGPILDEKIYPGTMCRPYFGQHWGDFSSTSTGFINNASETRTIVCPFVREHTSETTGPYYFDVEVENKTPGATLSCGVYTMSGIGTVVGSGSVSTSLQGKQFLTYQKSIPASRYSGEYTMYCHLPPKSGILAYKMREFAGYPK